MKTKTTMIISYCIAMLFWACIVALSKDTRTLLLMLANLIMTMALITYSKSYDKNKEEKLK